MTRRPTIYIAGPYTGRGLPWPLSWLRQVANILRAAWIAAKLMEREWAVICPHTMTCLLPLLSGYRLRWADFMDADLELLSRCDALFYIGRSRGADIELAAAERLGLAVYRRLDDVPWAGDFHGRQ